MHRRFWIRTLLTLTLASAGTACSHVEPAGSLGYMVDGNTRFRPVPKNYRHVPPIQEPIAPQFKITF